MDYSQYSHISFDLWLTLIQSNPYYKQKRNRLLIEFFDISIDPQIVDDTYNKFDRLFNAINEITGGNLDSYELWLIFLGELNINVKEVSFNLLKEFIAKTEVLFFQLSPILIDGNTPLLFERLVDEGHSLSLLCNTAFTRSHFLRKLLQQLGVAKYLAFQLYSDEMGYSKPNIIVYETLYREVQKIKPLRKNQIIHVGDNPVADFKGARNFGIESRLLLSGETVCTVFERD